MLDSRHLELTAISVHGNMLHPNKSIAKEHHDAFTNAVLLAEKLGIKTVNGFSGCPSGPGGQNPNWVTCPWPDEFRDILNYQWNEVAIPLLEGAERFPCRAQRPFRD